MLSVLILCTGNSCRSISGESLINYLEMMSKPELAVVLNKIGAENVRAAEAL